MKTIIKMQCAALFGFALLLSACEKEILDISKSGSRKSETFLQSKDAEAFQQKAFGHFDFDVAVQECSRTGKTLKVEMNSSEGFAFSWTLDGVYTGPKPQLWCVHATSATVAVTRKADGLTLSKTINLYDGPELTDNFDFDLVVSPCFANGATVEARTQLDAMSYAFLWEIDNKPAGHYREIDCTCGKVAKVKVTRLSDGAMRTKSAAIMPCGTDN